MTTATSSVRVHRAADRGHTEFDWLDSWHSFSFGHFFDPQMMNFGPLRVINDDMIAASGGFGMHPHQNMEIISYIAEGALEHRDSMGNGSVIRPGDIQLMRAGTGIRHSEFNPSASERTRLIQIWIEPATAGLQPDYQEMHKSAAEYPNQYRLLVDPDGTDGALTIAQDAQLYALDLAEGHSKTLDLPESRSVWVQMISGSATVAGAQVAAGDAVAISSTTGIEVSADDHVDALVFTLPPQV